MISKNKALNIAISCLSALKEINLYDDYQEVDKFTDEEYDEMVEMLRNLKNLRVICYSSGGVVQGARASHPLKFEVYDEDEAADKCVPQELEKLLKDYIHLPEAVF